MSEQSYLKAPSSANARVDIAGVEGSLEYIAENIGTEWCTLDDIKGIIDDSLILGVKRGMGLKLAISRPGLDAAGHACSQQ